jgi:hypothetical protein
MGLYNYVAFPAKCPQCGQEITAFQTKDDAQESLHLKTVDFRSVREFHSLCSNCRSWISVKLKEESWSKFTVEDYQIISRSLDNGVV